MGNSEVGHTNMGAGRIVYQDLTRIDKAIRDGELEANAALERPMDRCADGGTRCTSSGWCRTAASTAISVTCMR